jgi:hypothetical protein
MCVCVDVSVGRLDGVQEESLRGEEHSKKGTL